MFFSFNRGFANPGLEMLKKARFIVKVNVLLELLSTGQIASVSVDKARKLKRIFHILR